MKLIILLVVAAIMFMPATAPAKTITGCLTPRGLIVKVDEDDEPKWPCNRRQTQISWNEQGEFENLMCMDGEIPKYNATSNLWECATDEPTEPQFTPFVFRDRDGRLVGELLGGAILYRGDADSDYFSENPNVLLSLTPGGFNFKGRVDFELPDCEGEIYIENPAIDFFDLPNINVTNDPAVGAVAYVPAIPITQLGNTPRASRLVDGGGCVNISGNGGATLAEPVELGFFPPYVLTK